MDIKRNPISARDILFCFIITTLFKSGIVIASACLSIRPSVCLSVCLSVCYVISFLTIGRNPTKFGVRVISISGVCNSTFLPSPSGPWGGFKYQQLSLKSQFQRFLYQNFCLFLQIKEIGCSLCRLGHTPGIGTLGCLGVKIYFFQTWSCGISN